MLQGRREFEGDMGGEVGEHIGHRCEVVTAVGGDEDGLPPAVGVRCVEDLESEAEDGKTRMLVAANVAASVLVALESRVLPRKGSYRPDCMALLESLENRGASPMPVVDTLPRSQALRR